MIFLRRLAARQAALKERLATDAEVVLRLLRAQSLLVSKIYLNRVRLFGEGVVRVLQLNRGCRRRQKILVALDQRVLVRAPPGHLRERVHLFESVGARLT